MLSVDRDPPDVGGEPWTLAPYRMDWRFKRVSGCCLVEGLQVEVQSRLGGGAPTFVLDGWAGQRS